MFESLAKLAEVLRERGAAFAGASVYVGYTAAYAIVVHENVEAVHRVGMAKFLESAARDGASDTAKIVRKAVEGGATLEQSLLLGGLYMQRLSQERCPVLTGNLRASAFTRIAE